MGRRTPSIISAVRANVGYIRVSTADQAQGISLAAQEEKLRAFAFATGRTLERVYVDEALSGKNMARPALSALVNAVSSGNVASLFVFKIDRLTRSIRDLCQLVELFARHECGLVSISENIDTSTAAGRMVLNLLGILAQFEREQISERTSLSLTHLRKRRLPYGKTPFGFARVDGALIPIPERIENLRRMCELRAEGASYRQIVRWLEAADIPTSQGGRRWYPSAVRDIVTGPMAEDVLAMSL